MENYEKGGEFFDTILREFYVFIQQRKETTYKNEFMVMGKIKNYLQGELPKHTS